jgi:kinetochore protein Spc25
VDLDLLQGELDAARGQVEMWCAQRELSMKEAVAAHKTNMMEAEEQYVRLVEKEKDLAASGEEAQRRKEYERGELEALREEAAQAKELGEGLPQQLQALREQVRREEQELEGKVRALEGEEAVERRTLDAHLTAVAAYGDRLGLRFEIGDAEDLKFFFRNVDPNAHAREFMVAVRVRASGGYELTDADPDVEALTALLEECNKNDNLSKFVRGARAEFRKLVAADEVRAAAARAAEEAKKMPPLPAVALEPAPTPLRALGEDMVPL